jgi:tetratricopeptide (TPR) repeat protein
VRNKAEGNPLFVEEVLRAFVDVEGLAADTHGQLRGTDKPGEISLPDSLQGVIAARIDRLPPVSKEVLRAAAVIGRIFSRRLLAAVVPTVNDLADVLVQLEERELIRLVRPEPEAEYRFKHVLVQEAAYDGLLLRRRRELHQEVAAAMEALYPERVHEFFGLLAYHYTKAEMWGKAQDFLLAAGQQAGRIAADPETLFHFEQALEAHLRAHGGTWGELVSEQGVDWFLEWTGALVEQQRLGAIAGLIFRFRQNLVKSFGPDDPRSALVATILARAYLQQGAPAAAEALMEDVLAAQSRMTDSEGVRIAVLCCLATAKVHLDKAAEGEAILREILETMNRLEDLKGSPDHARVCHMLSALLFWTTRFAEARQIAGQGLASPGLRHGYVRDCLLTKLSSASRCMGDYAEAAEYARTLLKEAAHPLGCEAAWESLGQICLAQGAIDDAVNHFERAAALAEEWGSPHQQFAQTWSGLAEGLLCLGKNNEAEELARRALAMLKELPDYVRSAAVNPYCTLAGVALARGELADAGRFLASCEAMEEALQEHYLRPEILYRKARLRRRQGSQAEGRDLMLQACRILDGWRGSPHPRADLMRVAWALDS